MSQESNSRPDLGGPGGQSANHDDVPQGTAERADADAGRRRAELAETVAGLEALGVRVRPGLNDTYRNADCPACGAPNLGVKPRELRCYNGCTAEALTSAIDKLRAEAAQRAADEKAERERQAAELEAERRAALERQAAERKVRQAAEEAERERQAAEHKAEQERRLAKLPEALRDVYWRLFAPTIGARGTISGECPLCGEGQAEAWLAQGAISVWCTRCDNDDLCRELQLPTVADRESMLDWDAEPVVPEWLIPDVVARGQFVSVFGRRGGGKSLLKLDWAVQLAGQGERVLYLDAENPSGEVRLRLRDMGVKPETREHLDYRSFPKIGALDTEAGADNFVRAVRAAGAAVVILDTWSKFIAGYEKDPETHTRAYTLAIVPLRDEGVTILAGDHPGKDEKAGPRGGSSKSDNVDVEWRLTAEHRAGQPVRVTLENTKDRTGRCPGIIQLQRLTSPLRHEVIGAPGAHPPGVARMLVALEEVNIPPGTGRDTAASKLRAAGYTVRTGDLAAALKVRNV